MYAESRVRERLDIARRELGFELDYKSVEEIIAFDAALKREGKLIYNAAGVPCGTQNLDAAEAQFILNEQALVQCDAAYAATRYCFINSEEGVIDRFRFRVAQRILFEIICDLEERGAAIEILICKARQLGMSSLVEILVALRIIFGYGVKAVIASADQTKTQEMSHMLLMCYDMLPCWLRPDYTARSESQGGFLMFGQNATSVSFQHGSQKHGIATGSTPTIYHISEVALFGDAAVKLIDEGLWKAVHASSKVLGILESTGRGSKGWWAGTWYYSRDNWPHSRMCPLFLPWYCGMDIYPKPAWLRIRPIPSGWQPNKDTREHIARATLYMRSQPLLMKHLTEEQRRRGQLTCDHWTMPREQQWFWEVNHEEAKAKNARSSFLQEMAGDDDEALQHSTESVFGNEVIAEIDARRATNYKVYGLSGQSIESAHEPRPEDIDYQQDRIPVRYTSPRGESFRWELIPMKVGGVYPSLDERDPSCCMGYLIVWHPPRAGVNYAIGVDSSEGRGKDSTVISVWALGWGRQPDVQVAEFSSAWVSHVEAFAFVLAIAAYYKSTMELGVTKWKEPYVSIEQVAAVGDTCQLQMRKMGYSNFHLMSRYDDKNPTKRRTRKSGWFSFGWSRPVLLGNFVHWAKNGWAEINSPWLIEEMRHFEVHSTRAGKEKMEHEEDEHDDRIFAAAMGVFPPHDLEPMAERSQRRIDEAGGLPPINMGEYRGHVISSSQMNEKRVATLDDILYADSRLERLSR